VLYALTLPNERGETPVRTREVVETYRIVAHSEGLSPVSERLVRDYGKFEEKAPCLAQGESQTGL
jgi:cell division control protein 6